MGKHKWGKRNEQGNIRKKCLQITIEFCFVLFFVFFFLSTAKHVSMINISYEIPLEKTNYSFTCESQSQFFLVRAEILCPFPSPTMGIFFYLGWLGSGYVPAATVSVSSHVHQSHFVWKTLFPWSPATTLALIICSMLKQFTLNFYIYFTISYL